MEDTENTGPSLSDLMAVIVSLKEEMGDLKRRLTVVEGPQTPNPPLRTDTPVTPPRSSPIQFLTVDRADTTGTPEPHNPDTNTMPHSCTRSSKRVMLRPQDVTILTLGELQGVSGIIRLGTFFEQVEFCSDDDEERIRIARIRVEPGVLALLRSTGKLPVEGQPRGWEVFKTALKERFPCSTDMMQAWVELEGEHYNMEEPPRSFIDRLLVKLESFKMRFKGCSYPDAERLVRFKIWQGFEPVGQTRIRSFVDSDVPLDQFLGMVEREWQLSRAAGDPQYRRVLPITTTPSFPLPEVSGESQGDLKDVLLSLKKGVTTLNEELKNISKTGGKGKYCAYCKVKDHNLKECPHNPPRGVCFDCRRPYCRRGAEGCPKKANPASE